MDHNEPQVDPTPTASEPGTLSAPRHIGRDERLISALLTSPTVQGAAKKAGVSRRAIYRALGRRGFRERFLAAARDLTDAALGRLQAGLSDAVDALRRNLKCGDPATEIRAAAVLTDQALRAVELTQLSARLDLIDRLNERVVA
jgi:hypothetical protein